MKPTGLFFGCFSLLIIGTTAERCTDAFIPFECLFGCCDDSMLVYCCVSNGGGIALIVTGIVVVMVTILLCLRWYRGQCQSLASRSALTIRSPTTSSNTSRNSILTPNTGYGQNISFIAYPGSQQSSPYNDPPPSYSECVNGRSSSSK